jgi:glycosyl transferase family 87
MNARPASWSPPVDARRAALAAALALATLILAWVGLHRGFYRHSQIIDTPIYQRYGDAIANGRVPYRDFALEYPPAALPVFAVPSLLRSQHGDLENYRNWFEAEMLVCGGLLLAFMLSVLLRLEAGPLRMGAALAFSALAPLLLGSVVLSRFDLWPAALTVGALAAVLAGRDRLGSGVLGLAFAAKLYPAVLLPLVLAWVWRRAGRREAAICLAAFAAVALACFLPFLVLAPDGLWEALTRQTNRPLQIESLGAGVLLVAHIVGGLGITMRSGHGSQNLVGDLPDALAAIQTVLQLAALVGIWVWFARGPADRERLVRAWAASVCAFVALGKVLSPQFLIWLIPLVPLVRGRRGVAASSVLAAAFVITQLWFPFRYWRLALGFDELASWLVLARDLVLVALLAILVAPPWAPIRARSAVPR